ncbi:hypothetical protein Ahy_B03g061900 [Arachis hypogaea]|uniref:Protein FAR1-RELATED SEQUENCE n=1 Tax=Arachis hypogaea TaxID=3818 RepID=A0A444ZSC9_ARAHY|nr:hypothetical protein Ahy_B03g061900 [Arachis hypogaea]
MIKLVLDQVRDINPLLQQLGLMVNYVPLKKNLYNLVFGSFVDVNHHGYSTLIGCTLKKKKENIQSFKWLFECWLRCMGGKLPKDILTECVLMQRDIELCMPTTIHRWCI